MLSVVIYATRGCSGGKHHIGCAEKCIRPRRKNSNSFSARPAISKSISAPSLRPIQLRCISSVLQLPFKRVKIAQQAIGIRSNAQHPLPHIAADDGKSFFFLLWQLLHSPVPCQVRAPIHRGIGNIGKPEIRKKICAFFVRSIAPRLRQYSSENVFW